MEEKLLAELADETQYKIILVRGVSSPFKSKNIPGHIKVKNLITSGEIEEVLNSSKLLISRSGYSTIMDILEIDINAIFVPTPGQTEQEYLGERMAQNPKYRLLKQGDTTNITALLKELL